MVKSDPISKLILLPYFFIIFELRNKINQMITTPKTSGYPNRTGAKKEGKDM
jgi:hypothetical protein